MPDRGNEFGKLISQQITSESDTFYHHYDALGSTAALTDSSEVVTDEYAFEAFGETAAESGATPNPYQWVAQVGYRKDEGTSLYDLRRRNYDVSTGRFLSEDPVRSDEENLYRYVGNGSVGNRDPSGLQKFPSRFDSRSTESPGKSLDDYLYDLKYALLQEAKTIPVLQQLSRLSSDERKSNIAYQTWLYLFIREQQRREQDWQDYQSHSGKWAILDHPSRVESLNAPPAPPNAIHISVEKLEEIFDSALDEIEQQRNTPQISQATPQQVEMMDRLAKLGPFPKHGHSMAQRDWWIEYYEITGNEQAAWWLTLERQQEWKQIGWNLLAASAAAGNPGPSANYGKAYDPFPIPYARVQQLEPAAKPLEFIESSGRSQGLGQGIRLGQTVRLGQSQPGISGNRPNPSDTLPWFLAPKAPPKLPPFSGKTEGILRTSKGDVSVPSGVEGPAKSMPKGASGFDIVTRTHSEGHAAAYMRQHGIIEADVFINNPVICDSCQNLLPRMLAPNSKLTVVLPDSTRVTFTGGSNTVNAVLPNSSTVTYTVKSP